MKRAHKIALAPTPEQEVRFGQHAGYARFAYNWALGEFKAGLDRGVSGCPTGRCGRAGMWSRSSSRLGVRSCRRTQRSMRSSTLARRRPLRASIESVLSPAGVPVAAWDSPSSSGGRHEQGFRADNGSDTVRVDGKTVILPKIGMVAMVEDLRFRGSIREVTINRTAGTWFACFCVEDGAELPPVKDGPTIGVDVGVGTMAVCSDGTTVENPKALASGLKRLRRLDKAIARSRNIHGKSTHSNRRERLYCKRRNLHARVVNVRSDRHHKATTAIAKSGGRVVVETLNVSGMMRNRRLARAIADAGMSGFRSKLEYKCAWYGAEYVKADRWYASSKLCAHCGWKNEDLTLSDREWRCGGCGALNERDYNAAVNLSSWPGLSFPVSGRGDRVSPVTPAVVGEASTDSSSDLTEPDLRSDQVD